ncbi:MAG: Txe/YoeB family addiction module toxin [Nitrospinae bacterium]|nr:Txe/YoeB family addiction module toxin [Nitrospinota bacterium]
MRKIIFEAGVFEDFNEWSKTNRKIYDRIVQIIKDIDRSPFHGIGKPEPLRFELSGYWSRRINDEHRLVYKVTDDAIIIVSCKYHY